MTVALAAALFILAVLDGAFAGFRSSAGRTGLISHRQSDHQAARRGAGLACVLLAPVIGVVSADVFIHPTRLDVGPHPRALHATAAGRRDTGRCCRHGAEQRPGGRHRSRPVSHRGTRSRATRRPALVRAEPARTCRLSYAYSVPQKPHKSGYGRRTPTGNKSRLTHLDEVSADCLAASAALHGYCAPGGRPPYIISGPEQAHSILSFTGPATAMRGQTITLSGTLGGPSSEVGGQALTVTRFGPSGPTGVTPSMDSRMPVVHFVCSSRHSKLWQSDSCAWTRQEAPLRDLVHPVFTASLVYTWEVRRDMPPAVELG